MTRIVLFQLLSSIVVFRSIDGFVSNVANKNNIPVKSLHVLKNTLSASSCDYTISPSAGDERSISRAAKFMVESFWLPQEATPTTQSDGFTWAVTEDLSQRYGETMGGTRAFASRLLIATVPGDASTIVGMVGIDVTLIRAEDNVMYNREASEDMLKNVMTTLGPKQRREYKGSSIQNIVYGLLPLQTSAAVLSNLAVNPSYRRQGIALILCKEAERVVREEWSFDKLYLRVESSNVAGRALYEKQLNYELEWVEKNAVALRADLASGNFIECTSDTLALSKAL